MPSTLNASSIVALNPGLVTNYAALFGNFSQMSISLQTNSSGAISTVSPAGAMALVSSYQVVGTSGSGPAKVYQVSVNQQVPGSMNENLTAWVQANGTVNDVSLLGQNITGSQGTDTFAGFMSAFTVELQEQANLTEFTSSPAFHIVNQTTVTLGPSTLSVTNYDETATPIAFSICASSMAIHNFVVQIGTLPGSSFTLVTYENLQASIQTSSGNANTGLILKVLSVSK